MDGIKLINLVQTNPVVTKMQGIESGNLMVPVNNALVCGMSFLVADTRLFLDDFTILQILTNNQIPSVLNYSYNK